MESRSKAKAKAEEPDSDSPDMSQRLRALETKVLHLQSELRLVKRKLRTAEDSHSTATITRILKDILRKQEFTMTLSPNSDEIQITNILAMGGNWAQEDSVPDKNFVPLHTDTHYGDHEQGSHYDHQPTTQLENNDTYEPQHSETDSDLSWNESGTQARNKRKRKQGGVGPKSKKPGRGIVLPKPVPSTTPKKPKEIPVIELSDQNQEPTSDSGIVSPKTTPKKPKTKRQSTPNHDGTMDLVEMKKQFQLLLREKVEEDPELGPSQILENFLASLPPDIDHEQCAKMESIKRGIRRIRQQIRTPGGCGSEDSS